MKPMTAVLDSGSAVLHCTYERKWPPPSVAFSGDEAVDNMWRSGEISEQEWEQIKTWRRVCGLMDMGPKCTSCPWALKETRVLHNTVLTSIILPPSNLPQYMDKKKTRAVRHG
jgi:hypothetical protein